MLDLSILVPVLGRAHLIEPLLDDIAIATPCKYEVVLIGTQGDESVARVFAKVIMAREHRLKVYTLKPNKIGDYARKINLGYSVTDSRHLFLGATDLHFHPGWYEAILDEISPRIGAVGTQDLGNSRVIRGQHATHSLVIRRYVDQQGTIDEPGKVLHEGYWHECVDDEFVETAKYRRAWAFAEDSIVEHMHPLWGKAETDPMYELSRTRTVHGLRLLNKRRRLWT